MSPSVITTTKLIRIPVNLVNWQLFEVNFAILNKIHPVVSEIQIF